MISNWRSPLTPLAQDSLNVLASALPSEGELTYEHAYAILKDREELAQPAAKDIIERLSLRGYRSSRRKPTALVMEEVASTKLKESCG
jgi:hypothetical protein